MADVAFVEGDMGEAAFRALFTGQGELGFVEIEADDPAAGADPIRKIEGHLAGPAADIDGDRVPEVSGAVE